MEKVRTLRGGISVELSEPTPLVLHVVTKKGGDSAIGGGMPMVQERLESFVCVNQLPVELQERIKTAINFLSRA